ncbi:MAG: hypothetical protein PHU53_02725 [Thermoplasmata archaeon]|nr:hypothetical protein [Thermoplasmata archaeon]
MSINRHASLDQNIRGLGASPTLALNERCKQMKKDGIEVLNLGIGESPFPVPKYIVDSLRQYATEKGYLHRLFLTLYAVLFR